MARIWTVGAELQTTTNGVEWDHTNAGGAGGSVTIETTTIRSGSASIKFTSSSGNSNYIDHSYAASDVVSAARIYVNFASFPSDTESAILEMVNNAGTTIACIGITTTGKLRLHDGNSASSQIGSDSSTLSTGTWYRVEIRCENGGSPEVEARIDGTAFASGSYTTATNCNAVNMGITDWVTGCTLYIDDIAINDNSGSAQTSWPGAGSVVHLTPNAAGDNAGWADGDGGGGANYTKVDEVTPDDATTYVKRTSGTPIDDHNVTSSSSAGIGSSDTITLVHVRGRVKATSNTAAAGRNGKFRIKSAASGTVSSSASLDWSQTAWVTDVDNANGIHVPQLTSYTDPTTGVAWTPTGTNSLDNMQIGYTPNASSTTEIDVSTVWAVVEYVPNSAQNISPSLIISSSVIYSPTLTTKYIITPSLISSPATIYEPSQIKGVIGVTPSLITSTPTVNQPTITTGAVAISPSIVTSAATIFDPIMSVGAVSITPELILSSPDIYLPSINTFSNISANYVTSTSSVLGPDLALEYTISPEIVTSTPSVQSPTLTTGSVTITPDLITASPTVYDASLEDIFIITPNLVTSDSQVYEPNITLGAVTITPDLLQSLPNNYQPSFSFAISTGFINGQPTINDPLFTLFITPELVINNSNVFTPSIEEGAGSQNISPTIVVSSPSIYPPTINTTVTILATNANSSPQAYNAALTPQAVTITPDIITSISQLYDLSFELTATIAAIFINGLSSIYEPTLENVLPHSYINPDKIVINSEVYEPKSENKLIGSYGLYNSNNLRISIGDKTDLSLARTKYGRY